MAAAQNAVVLEFAPGRRAAIALHQVSELVLEPKLVNVPQAPAHCHRLCLWQDRAVPYADLSPLIGAEEPVSPYLALVVNYARSTDGEPCWAALGLRDYFRIVNVTDNLACGLPDDFPFWPRIARSCFMSDEQRTPILDLDALFENRLN